MKNKHIKAFMDVAEIFAKLSSAKRLQVGAIVVKDDAVISIGYNGMPSGWDNTCENLVYGRSDEEPLLVTKPEVIHAEANAIAKLAKSTTSSDGAYMFVTHAPCIECSKQIYTAGISKVIFKEHYRDTKGIQFLSSCGIEVVNIQDIV